LARIVWLALALVALFAMAYPARAQAGGVIAGRVVNATAGGPAIGAGLPVILHITQGETELDPLTTTTDELGSFRFDGLDTDSKLAYWPEVTYLDVPYAGGEPYGFAEGQTELEATLTVYETTEDGSGVRVDSVHMIAESFEQVLRISEVHVFGNEADRTFIGQANEESNGQNVTVFIPLPDGAVGLAFPEDAAADRYVEVEGGIWDTNPVPPGAEASVVRFSYHLLVEGTSVPLDRSFAYSVPSLTLLVVQPGLAVGGDQLQPGEPVEFQGTNYEVYLAEGLGPAAPLSIELLPATESGSNGMPEASTGGVASQPAEQGQQGVLKWLGLGLAVLAGAGALLYALVTRPRTRV
jgi:hypothetical protein